jgi:hypothetical protein
MTPEEVNVHVRRVVVDASVGGKGAEWSAHSLTQALGEAIAGRGEWGGAGMPSYETRPWDMVASQVVRAVVTQQATMPSSGGTRRGRVSVNHGGSLSTPLMEP